MLLSFRALAPRCLRWPTQAPRFASALASERRRFATETEPQIWEYLRTEKRENGVAVVRLHRPDALNALSGPLMGELVGALGRMDADAEVKAVVLTGSERAFAAGADIKEMKDKNFAEVGARDDESATISTDGSDPGIPSSC